MMSRSDKIHYVGWTFYFLFLSVVLILTGCAGTITPDHIQSSVPATDTSTPDQYWKNDNGFIGVRIQAGKKVGVVTQNKRIEFNGLIAKYRIQFKSEYPGIWLEDDYGLIPYIDQYENNLWAVDLTALGYYWYLEQWKRNKKPGDSLWVKALEAL